jgi:hypothetical protein
MLDLIKVLVNFETAILKFEASKEPTIQHVVPQYLQLKSVDAPKATDSEVMSKFRKSLDRQLELKFKPNITMRHKMALFLWPKFSSLAVLPVEEHPEVGSLT